MPRPSAAGPCPERHDDNGYLGIYFDIYNREGEKLAVVKRNEIYIVKGKNEDYRLDGSADRVTFIEQATGQALCDIKKRGDAGDVELDVSVHLYTPAPGHLLIDCTTGTNLGGLSMIGNTFRSMRAAIGIS